jgi:acyl carrier protein
VIDKQLRRVLRNCLQLGDRADALSANSRLLGALPELDSMAVVTVITAVEEDFGLTIDDDEINAEVFETFGSLVGFISKKLESA